MKHMKMMWNAEIEIFKWRYDRRMYESRNRTQNIEPHVCDCLLLLPFSLRECSKFWVSSEAGRTEGNIGVISFLNPITGDGISGENQPAVFVAISCRLRPAQENECSRDYLFFFLHSWNYSVNSDPIIKHLFVAGMKRGKTHAPAITLYFFSLLIGWEVRAWILIQWQSYFLLPAQSAGKRVLPWIPLFSLLLIGWEIRAWVLISSQSLAIQNWGIL